MSEDNSRIEMISEEDMIRLRKENLSFGEVQNELGEKLTNLLMRCIALPSYLGVLEVVISGEIMGEAAYISAAATDVISLMDRAQAMVNSNE